MTENEKIDSEIYLKTGAHIGTKFKSGDMTRYIYKTRKDGLKVLNIDLIDERISTMAKFLSKFPAEKIAVVSRKLYGRVPIEKFAELTGARAFSSRFVPGTFSNPYAKEFFEPEVVIVTEPESDWQAINEAKKIRVPVIGLCSINNSLKYIDMIVPINNKGRQSLALAYWLLAKRLLIENSSIKNESEFKTKLEDFEYKLKEGEEQEDGLQKRFSSRGPRQDRFGRSNDRKPDRR